MIHKTYMHILKKKCNVILHIGNINYETHSEKKMINLNTIGSFYLISTHSKISSFSYFSQFRR